MRIMALQATDYLITGSVDGHLKFWKKKPEGVEFVKHFRAHKGAIAGETAAWHARASSACSHSDGRVQRVSLRSSCLRSTGFARPTLRSSALTSF